MAASYDDSESAEFEPGVVEATVDALAGLAGLAQPLARFALRER